MGSRLVLSYGEDGNYIQKRIPPSPYDSLKNIDLPSFDEYMDTHYLDLNTVTVPAIKIAIEQQYNEWDTWFNASEQDRRLLAPIVGTGWDANYMPILYFPRFIPLISEKEMLGLNNTENLIIMGMRLQELKVAEHDVLDFFRGLPALCDYLGLNEEDIINNPSNIGYNSSLGLKIIDYGLKNG